MISPVSPFWLAIFIALNFLFSRGAFCKDGPMAVKVVTIDEREILCPANGYFNLDGYFHFNRRTSSDKEKMTNVPYLEHQHGSKYDMPFFYKMKNLKDIASYNSALLYNKSWREQHSKERKLNTYLEDNSWSLSSSRTEAMVESFHAAPYPFIVDSVLLGDNGNFYIPPSLKNFSELWKSLKIVDLTFSRLTDLNYKFLSELPSLRCLALTFSGGELNNDEFLVNKRVEELVVWNTSLGKQAFKTLFEFSQVRKITFNGCDISHIAHNSSNLNEISKITNRITDLQIANCSEQLYEILNLCEWNSLQRVIFDFMPRGDQVIGNRRFSGNQIESIILQVPRERLDLFTSSRSYRRIIELGKLEHIDLVTDIK